PRQRPGQPQRRLYHAAQRQWISGPALADQRCPATRRKRRGALPGEGALTFFLPSPLYSGGEGLGVRGWGTKRQAPPHPQPLSPEYRGEGRKWLGLTDSA